MGTFNGNMQGGRFAAVRGAGKRKRCGAGKQILFSVLLLIDLFLLYTIIMQLTHQQKAFEASRTVNLVLLAVLAVGAVALIWAVIRTNAWKRFLCLFLIFAICYVTVVFSGLPIIKKYREMWISTAWSTMRHQGLATYYFPPSVVREVTEREEKGRDAQVGDNTLDTFAGDGDEHLWTDPTYSDAPTLDSGIEELDPEQQAFYTLFYELDIESAEAYFEAHPEALAKGYSHVEINEAGLKKDGTEIRTRLGEKVLAIDAENQILLLEVDCDGSRGVLAIGKLPSRLHLYAAANLPYRGETAGSIAKRHDGLIALTGSGFEDEGGVGNGGQVCGYAMCDGKEYKGTAFKWGYKRLEMRGDKHWFYITDTFEPVNKETTDAMEFSPALLINGKKLDPGIWTSQNPRACIGQSKYGEILMLAVEGRTLASPGCSVTVCAEILLQHDGITAMNCDGGTTAIMWYKGEPVIRCSNAALPQGRNLPNAWVYVGK